MGTMCLSLIWVLYGYPLYGYYVFIPYMGIMWLSLIWVLCGYPLYRVLSSTVNL